MSDWLVAFFHSSGVPQTGLSPTIRIRDLSDNSLVITDATMVETGDGFYKYDFTAYDASKDYTYRADGGDTLDNEDRYKPATNDGNVDDMKSTVDTNLDTTVSSRTTLGTGNTAKTYTVNDDDGNPLSGVRVDVRAVNNRAAMIVAQGTTNDAGQITFDLDSGVTYYFWRYKAGHTFTNPDTEVV